MTLRNALAREDQLLMRRQLEPGLRIAIPFVVAGQPLHASVAASAQFAEAFQGQAADEAQGTALSRDFAAADPARVG
jgi:hypothetical protein